MKYLVANPDVVAVRQPDWENNYTKLLPELHKLQVVSHGETSLQQAKRWLECVCKVHPLPVAMTCISQAGGLGARDMRSLIAHESGEYYPALSANEIYQSKQLKAFPVDFRIAKNEEAFVLNAVREILFERSAMVRNLNAEQTMLNGNGNLWLRSRPSLFGKVGQDDVIVDIHINRGEKVSHSDETRLHYHELVANSVGLKPKSLFQANIQIAPEFKAQLVKMALISPGSEAAAIEILKEAIRHHSKDVVLSTSLVQPNQPVYQALVQAGHKHWSNIIGGIQLDHQQDAGKAVLSPGLAAEFTDLSKRLVVAASMAKQTKKAEVDARAELSMYAMVNGIHENVAFPYEATQLREYNEVDFDAVFKLLTTYHNIPPEQLQHKEINQDRLFELTRAHGLDINSAITHTGFNKSNITTLAEEVGLNLCDYTTTSMRPYISGQSRGPVKDALTAIQAMIAEATENKRVELTASDQLNDPNLTGGLKGSGVSLVEMEF